MLIKLSKGAAIHHAWGIRLIAGLTITGVLVASCSSADTTASSPPARVLSVPSAEAPTIDGIMSTGEWDGATSTTMTSGDPLYWMHSDGTLYVALEGSDVGAINVAVAIDDEVWILHSSAALGSALYTKQASKWTISHNFSWCCRSGTDDAGREALLAEEGWQANIGFAGETGVVEYEVEMPWSGAFAAVSYQTETGDPAYWPTDLSSNAELELIGPWPETSDFHLNEWFVLESG